MIVDRGWKIEDGRGSGRIRFGFSAGFGFAVAEGGFEGIGAAAGFVFEEVDEGGGCGGGVVIGDLAGWELDDGAVFRHHAFVGELGGFGGVGIKAGEFFQLGERDFRFVFAIQAEGDFGRAAGGVIEQAFVNVADLFDVEGAEGDAPRFRGAAAWDAHSEELEGFEQVEDHAVVHRQRVGRGIAPAAGGFTAFEERVAIGIEKRSAVGRETHGLVLHAAVDGTEGGQQTRPGIVAAFKDFLAVLVGAFAQEFPQGRDGVVLAEQEEAAFFGGEEKNYRRQK
jgi:hypothetical protein